MSSKESTNSDEDGPAELQQKAEACLRLAELSDDPERRALWLQRAEHWVRLAEKAATKARRRK